MIDRLRHILACICIGCLLYIASGVALWEHLCTCNHCNAHIDKKPTTPGSSGNQTDAPPLHDTRYCPICHQLLDLGKTETVLLACITFHVEPDLWFDSSMVELFVSQDSPIDLQPRAPPIRL